MTPAATSSSVNRSIASHASAVGGTPFSLSSVAFAKTRTRIVCLLLCAGRNGPAWERRTRCPGIDTMVQIFSDGRAAHAVANGKFGIIAFEFGNRYVSTKMKRPHDRHATAGRK